MTSLPKASLPQTSLPQTSPLKILLVSTCVGPLGSGKGGGVELTLANVALALQLRGHQVGAIAPAGSICPGLALTPVPGQLQSTAQNQGRQAGIEMPAHSALAQAWEAARNCQGNYDIILNFAYDWLPFYLTPFFSIPVVHLVSMGSLSEAMDHILGQTLASFPHSLACHSRIQAETFTAVPGFAAQCTVLGNGFDLSRYQFQPQPQPWLGWVGRIAPEKGLEDAVAAAVQARMPLKVWGAMEYPDYWTEIQQRFTGADNGSEALTYGGFLSTDDLQQQLGYCQGLIMTPKWVEAFGNVAIEALACGVPVVAYARGGPVEIVRDGETGFLVEPDSVAGLVAAIAQLPRLDRSACRQQAEADYSLAAMGARTEAWLRRNLTV
ncbi:MAG: glycosyltransferase family 4 protein [Synechococcales cyanobacterium RM1_1_8]|nr:glycosyltransferase family 4 protein [Synechococcales cyanobacterium RM1_1_8]